MKRKICWNCNYIELQDDEDDVCHYCADELERDYNKDKRDYDFRMNDYEYG